MTEAITPDNIAGLVVGEGCFYAESAADPKYKLGWRIRPGFCIEMRSDELPVLEAVQAQIGCGAIYELDFGRYRGYEGRGWHPHVKYRVTRIGDLNDLVVPFFIQHPLFGRKHDAFEIFRELVWLLATAKHRDEAGLAQAQALADKLSEHNRRGRSSLGADR